MKGTQPIFVVSSGRSGTYALAKALALHDTVSSNHEYMIQYTQPTAFQYYHHLTGLEETCETLDCVYGSAVAYSNKEIWIDSSNKASWLIYPILKVFPNAKFIWLVRDGRKVVSSFFWKLAKECYDFDAVESMYRWMHSPDSYPMPPPEKKYWWPLPPGVPGRFQFDLLCWHWAEVNRVIDNDLGWVNTENRLFMRLEDLATQRTKLEELLNFLDLPWRDDVWEQMRIPENVGKPEDALLTPAQLEVFWKECGTMMKRFSYTNTEEYKMEYNHKPFFQGVD